LRYWHYFTKQWHTRVSANSLCARPQLAFLPLCHSLRKFIRALRNRHCRDVVAISDQRYCSRVLSTSLVWVRISCSAPIEKGNMISSLWEAHIFLILFRNFELRFSYERDDDFAHPCPHFNVVRSWYDIFSELSLFVRQLTNKHINHVKK